MSFKNNKIAYQNAKLLLALGRRVGRGGRLQERVDESQRLVHRNSSANLARRRVPPVAAQARLLPPHEDHQREHLQVERLQAGLQRRRKHLPVAEDLPLAGEAHRVDLQLLHQREEGIVVGGADEAGAGVDDRGRVVPLAAVSVQVLEDHGVAAAAEAGQRLQDDHVKVEVGELAGGGEAGHSGADDDDSAAVADPLPWLGHGEDAKVDEAILLEKVVDDLHEAPLRLVPGVGEVVHDVEEGDLSLFEKEEREVEFLNGQF